MLSLSPGLEVSRTQQWPLFLPERQLAEFDAWKRVPSLRHDYRLLPMAYVTNANGGFLCAGAELYGPSGPLGTSDSAADCQTSVNNANGGFLCSGAELYGPSGPLGTSGSAANCQLSVNSAKSGFLCSGAELYGPSGPLGTNDSAADCQTYVNNASK
jgi:hypothetical protein